MASNFKMQIVDIQTGHVVEFEPGRRVERDFVEDCITKILSKGVGIGRTSNHVSTDIRAGIEEAIFELKAKVRG